MNSTSNAAMAYTANYGAAMRSGIARPTPPYPALPHQQRSGCPHCEERCADVASQHLILLRVIEPKELGCR